MPPFEGLAFYTCKFDQINIVMYLAQEYGIYFYFIMSIAVTRRFAKSCALPNYYKTVLFSDLPAKARSISTKAGASMNSMAKFGMQDIVWRQERLLLTSLLFDARTLTLFSVTYMRTNARKRLRPSVVYYQQKQQSLHWRHIPSLSQSVKVLRVVISQVRSCHTATDDDLSHIVVVYNYSSFCWIQLRAIADVNHTARVMILDYNEAKSDPKPGRSGPHLSVTAMLDKECPRKTN